MSRGNDSKSISKHIMITESNSANSSELSAGTKKSPPPSANKN